ncbi:hypothetical protein ACTXT7_017217, partial [Hymenolepis weldensis]
PQTPCVITHAIMLDQEMQERSHVTIRVRKRRIALCEKKRTLKICHLLPILIMACQHSQIPWHGKR